MISRFKDWLQHGAWHLFLELLLITALGISLAYWTWAAVTPPAVAAPTFQSQAETVTPITGIKRELFGSALEENSALAPMIAAVKLVGVIAPHAQRTGRAIFMLDGGKPSTVAVGDPVSAGWVLEEVHADHVVLSRDGLIERIKLERRGIAPPKS